jgi:hypothetical protein
VLDSRRPGLQLMDHELQVRQLTEESAGEVADVPSALEGQPFVDHPQFIRGVGQLAIDERLLVQDRLKGALQDLT